ncbi:JmjC domain-containing histone demethylation protein 1 [Agyrium rufum]|nr:JmjC domain-containing histone demethylation protein 1 [Agyrium rufum]
MAAHSFKIGRSLRPEGYRTPSPPSFDYEPVSPSAEPSRFVKPPLKRRRDNLSGKQNGFTQIKKENLYVQKNSGNGLDAFASIVLATDTRDSFREPSNHKSHIRSPLSANFTQSSPFERPHKRSRSEKLDSPEVARKTTRPFTSYVQQSTDRWLDAELLLNFSQGARLSVSEMIEPRSITIVPQTTHEVDGHVLELEVNRTRDKSPVPLQNQQEIEHQDPSLENAQMEEIRIVSVSDKSSTEPSQDAVQVPAIDSFEKEIRTGTEGFESNANDTIKSGRACYNNSISNPSTAAVEQLVLRVDPAIPSMDYQEPAVVNETRPSDDPSAEQVTMDYEPTSVEVTLDQAVNDADHHQPKDHDQTVLTETAPMTAPTTMLPPKLLSSKEMPSICAACNFARNNLTADTENSATSWISCDACKDWFHFACAGFMSEREVRAIDKYRCKKCKPIHGATTFVRKSSRAHSAIDYAGLHEGKLVTSADSPEHHYIKPIKDGVIKFNPENFARIHPSLVTADYFQKCESWTEPVVIPADMNPRPPRAGLQRPETSTFESDIPVTDDILLQDFFAQGIECESVEDYGQDALDMIIPQGLTVRTVSALYGPDENIEVIDVKSQDGEDKKRWTLRKWVEYYESKEPNKTIRNVISLEVSQSRLGRLIRRPKVVRDMDLQDSVWPDELKEKGDYPKVQFYCLMSVADCFTDFHIDFGGSSVYYHILKGKKTFFFIPPHEKNLKKYEDWNKSRAQNWTFLGDQTKECYRVDLSEGDTMLIPAGWIHAVWTPEDSLVIGGNFLTRLNFDMQIRVAQIEKATDVPRKFRYPQFQKVMWFTAMRYLEDDPLPESVTQSLLSGQSYGRDVPTYDEFNPDEAVYDSEPEKFHARYYSKSELDGLPGLARYLQRTALIAMEIIKNGISVKSRNAVKKSIPKLSGEPLDFVKKFAIWIAWKRGNEPMPHWAYPDFIPDDGAPELTEKKLSARALKQLEREAAIQAFRVAPSRQSARIKSQPLDVSSIIEGAEVTSEGISYDDGAAKATTSTQAVPNDEDSTVLIPCSQDANHDNAKSKKKRKLSDGASRPRKAACESCRKRRRACKHNNIMNPQQSIPEKPSSDPATTEIRVEATRDTQPQDASAEDAVAETVSPNRLLHVEIIRTPPKESAPIVNLTSTDLTPQPSSMTSNPTPASGSSNLSIKCSSSSPLKAQNRGRACADCRRSKRRCPHDEKGNVDPVKAQEIAIARPNASRKRKATSDTSPGIHEEKNVKKSKKSSFSSSTADPVGPQQVLPTSSQSGEENSTIETVTAQPATDFVQPIAPDRVVAKDDTSVSPGIKYPETEMPHDTIACTIPLSSPSLVSARDLHPSISVPTAAILKSEADQSQLPASSLVSPPASSHTGHDGSPAPEGDHITEGVEVPASFEVQDMNDSFVAPSSRHSSRRSNQIQRYTPESGSTYTSLARRRESKSSTHSSGFLTGRTSASPAVTSERAVKSMSRRRSSVSQPAIDSPMKATFAKKNRQESGSFADADEESLKLIRKLQAQDMGLRRRR